MAAEELEVVFLIADLSGYTALTEVHGNIQAAGAVTRYAEIAQAALHPGARLLERVGDEVVIAAPEAAAVVRTAITLRENIEQEPLFPTVRCGVHAGVVVERDGRYFCGALNLTARVANHARGGQILCTAAVTARAAALDDVDYRPLGGVRFKNILDPVPVFEVVVGRRSSEAAAIDPVCRMQVRIEAAPARLPFGGRMYCFCSFDCARAFAERPEQYAVPAPS